MGLGSKKKTYADRNPNAAAVYKGLTAAQQKILDEFSYRESKTVAATAKKALQRIAEEYVIPRDAAASEKKIKREAEALYGAATRLLQSSEVTTNINAKLFTFDDFFNGNEVKTVWTHNTGKGANYNAQRQAVEEKAFGFTIDWAVPIRVAAMTRPVYAGLNFTRHPYGAAAAYGSVVLVYKSSVLHRSTFLHKDTFDDEFKFSVATGDELERQRSKICTWAQMGVLIGNMSKSQLKAVMEMAQGSYVIGSDPPNYLEAQILGGAQWTRDLEEIRVATTGQSTIDKEAGLVKKSPATVKHLVGEFAKKHGVPAKTYSLGSIVEVLN